MKLYIAGPMSGIEEFNYPAFHRAARDLGAMGFQTENPADNDDGTQETWADYMRLAIPQMLRCDGVAVLDGWEGSAGAQLEVHIARALSMPVQPVSDWFSVNEAHR